MIIMIILDLIFRLTVDEHMFFFGTLRGLSKDFIASETKRLLGDLNLDKKLNTVTSKLSGLSTFS